MYRVYLNKLLLPITPSEITMSIKSKNKKVNLLNDREINIRKPDGLVEFSFDAILPAFNYPFSTGKVYDQKYYLDQFEFFKTFDFMQLLIVRERPNGNDAHTLKNVTLEDYTIKDSTDEGFDLVVSFNFTEYVPYGTQVYKIGKKGKNKKERPKKSFAGKKYIIKRNDTLEKIVRKKMSDNPDNLQKNRNRLWQKNKKIIQDACKKTYGTDSYKGEILVEGTVIRIAMSIEEERREKKASPYHESTASPEKIASSSKKTNKK